MPGERISDRLRARSDVLRDISQLSDRDTAAAIRADRIDILVDLTSHGPHSCLGIFALKPAPVQVTYLGHPDTSGVETMDYRLTDSYCDSPLESESFCTEQVIRLPRTALCYEPPVPSPAVEPPPCMKTGFVTFGSLNVPTHVTAKSLQLWCRILQRVKGSRLLLRYDVDSPMLHDVLLEERIDPSRVERLAPFRSQASYLDAFKWIDILLDPFPYHGHVTSCDGAWMGVPMITLAGDRCASRMGVNVLANLELPDLIARTEDEYIEKAVTLANDHRRLNALRPALRARVQNSPLLDAEGITRDIEAAYRRMWQKWCSTLPRAASVPASHA